MCTHVFLAVMGGSSSLPSHWLRLYPLLPLPSRLICDGLQSVCCLCSWVTDKASGCCCPGAHLRSTFPDPSSGGRLLLRLCFHWLLTSASGLLLLGKSAGILAPLRCGWLFTHTLVHSCFVFSNLGHNQMEAEALGLEPKEE